VRQWDLTAIVISILVFNAVLSTKLISSRRKRLGVCMVYAIFFNLVAWLGWIGWLAAQGPDYKRKTTPPLDWNMGGTWAKAFVVSTHSSVISRTLMFRSSN
jgi:hypothetical protein